MQNNSFRHYYELPLEQDDVDHQMVWTKDYNRAFDFANNVSEQDAKKIVDKLNGKVKEALEGKLSHEAGEIFLDGQMLLYIRSWGRLTGGGALNLKPQRAALIQDDFCEWIIKTLKENTKK